MSKGVEVKRKLRAATLGAGLVLLLNGSGNELVEARKRLISQEVPFSFVQSENRNGHPVVEADTCEKICPWKDNFGYNKWCIKLGEPALQAGWEWTQVNHADLNYSPQRYLRLDLDLYSQVYLNFESELKVYNFYWNKVAVKLKELKASIYGSLIINEDAKFCPGFGWKTGVVRVDFDMEHYMQDCYKTILKNFWSAEGIWKGADALFLEC